MTTTQPFDPSMLVLKMIGGALDGKLLPINTQKCFLTGGEKQSEGQCAIIRGPGGTALKSVGTPVVVNERTDNLHWLQEGDTIKIGETIMYVEQLGRFGDEVENASVPSETPHEITQDERSTDAHSTQTSVSTGSTAVNEILTQLQASANEAAADEAVGSSIETPDTAQTETDPELKTDTAPEVQSRDTARPTDTEANELLARALRSLESANLDAPPASIAPVPPVEEPQQEVSAEENVDNTLAEIQSQLDSQIQSYSSTPETSTVTNASNDQIDSPSPTESPEAKDSENPNNADQFATPKIELPIAETPPEIQTLNEDPQSEAVQPGPELPPSPIADSQPEPQPQELTQLADIMRSLQSSPELETADEAPTPTSSPNVQSESNDAGTPDAEPNPPTQEPETTSAPAFDMASFTSRLQSQANATSDASAAPLEPQGNAGMPAETAEPAPMMDLPTESTDTYSETLNQNSESTTLQPNAFSPETELKPVEEMPVATPQQPASPSANAGNESVAEVLARMQSQGQLDNFQVPSDSIVPEETMTPEMVAPEPLQSAPALEPAPQPTEPTESEGGDGSVQDYMNQLFQRLRGSDAPDVAIPNEPSAPAPTVIPPSPQQAAENQPKEVERLLSATEYVPKQQAPEVKSDLEAMRLVANAQSRKAVQISATKKTRVDQTLQQCLAAGCFVAMLVFAYMAESWTDSNALAAFGCGCVCLMASVRFYTTWRSINHESNKAQAENENSPPASEEVA